MKRKTPPTNLKLEANIIKALNHIRNNYSYTEPKRFEQDPLFEEVKISRVFVTIIKKLGIIEYPIPAHIVITNKIDTIPARQIHLALNEYSNESQKRSTKKKQKQKAKELAKIQAQIRFENKQKLRGFNTQANELAYKEALRNAPPMPEVTNMQVPTYPQGAQHTPSFVPNLFDVQGAYYPQMNNEFNGKDFIDTINAMLPKNYKIQDMLNSFKAALRQEIKDELRREIINELVSKG